MFKLLFLLVFLALTGVNAVAQFRTLPASARHAVSGAPQIMPYVELNGRRARLAPGAVIFDADNRTVVQSALPIGVHVLYTTDMNGDVSRIYVLTAQERAQLKH